MYFDSKPPSSLYYSSVKETRPSSATNYQKRTSSEYSNQLKPLNHALPAFLNNTKKEDYKINVVVSAFQKNHQEAIKYKGDSFVRYSFEQKAHQSKSANKYEDGFSNQNIANINGKHTEGQFDNKEMVATRPRRSSETNNLSHIMQKLQKKEQLIKELQKICENKVSDNIRKSSQDKQKVQDLIGLNLPKYSANTLKNDKLSSSQAYKTSLDIPGSPAMDLNLSVVSARSKRDTNFSYLKQFQASSKPVRKESDSTKSNKNPQQTLKGGQRMQYNNWSPRQYKGQSGDFKNKQRSKMQMEKITSNLDIPYSDQNYDKYKNKSSTYNSYNYIEISSPTLEKKKEQELSYRDRKNAKDVRNIIQNRNIEKKSNYFSSRKVSISDFDLKKTLGEGKFGVVYQAFHIQTKTLYALKKISKKVIKSNLMIDQLLQEIKIQFFCSHENILKIYGFFDDSQFIYLILEYMQEGTLFASLKKQKTLTQKEAAAKLKDIAKAIVYLQQNGIAHRDIKPQNIVMSNGVCKLCDFGWAAICTDRRKTYCGTFDYVAPEILQGNEYDVTVDLWCLGVMAYELMVGKAPFYHISRKQTMKKIMNVQKTALQFPPHLSKNAVSFIQSLIKKNPEERLNGDSILKHPFLAQNQQTIY